MHKVKQNEEQPSGALKAAYSEHKLDEDPIISTSVILFERLRQQQPTAAGLLCMLSFYDGQYLPLVLLRKQQGTAGRDDSPSHLNDGPRFAPHDFLGIEHMEMFHRKVAGPDLKQKFTEMRQSQLNAAGADWEAANDETLAHALDILKEYQLISVMANGETINVQGVVQTVVRSWMISNDELQYWALRSVINLIWWFKGSVYDSRMRWNQVRELLPHVKQMHWSGLAGIKHVDMSTTLLSCAAALACDQGLLNEAEVLANDSRGMFLRLHGENHRDTWASTQILTQVLMGQGKPARAEEFLRGILISAKSMENRTWELKSALFLAQAIGAQQRYPEAEAMLRTVFEDSKQALGPGYEQCGLHAQACLAELLVDQEKHAAAQDICREEIAMEEEALPDHPLRQVEILTSLRFVEMIRGRYTRAEQMSRQSIRILEHACGREHPKSLHWTLFTARLLLDQGSFQQAFQRLLRARIRVLGWDHADTLTSLDGLRNALRYQSKFRSIEMLQNGVIAKSQKTSGYSQVIHIEHLSGCV